MLVGVTGNFASGKSSFCKMLSDYGVEVFDADRFVDYLYKKDEVREIIKKQFGDDAVTKNGVDKAALAKIVFSDYKKLQKLNSIIHPMIRSELKKIDHDGKLVVAEIPLLFEAGMEGFFDKVIVVKCPESIALQRAVKKGFSEDDFKKRMSFQWRDPKKEEIADFVVDSDCSIDELRTRAEEISKELIALGKSENK